VRGTGNEKLELKLRAMESSLELPLNNQEPQLQASRPVARHPKQAAHTLQVPAEILVAELHGVL
jgi:hypothetical protein